MQAKLAEFDENGDCKSGQLALYLEKNHTESKSVCQALMNSLKEKYLDPLTKSLSPQTDFRKIESAFISLISAYNETCVGPASHDVLDAFIQVRTMSVLIIQSILLEAASHTHIYYCRKKRNNENSWKPN